MTPQIERALGEVPALLRETAERVILPRFQALASHEIREKSGADDLVTIADEEAEALLTEGLLKLLPGALVVGEEAVAAAPEVIHRLAAAEPVWVIDPIDGTANFASGDPRFAVMVALVQGNETRAAFVYDPRGDRMAEARPGGGAYINGARVRLPARRPGPVRVSVSVRFWPPEITAAARLDTIEQVEPMMCAGHEYLRLVAGGIDAASYWRLLPWDHAAPALIALEAGARIAHPDGSLYRPYCAPRLGLIAAHPDVWDEACRASYPDLSLVPGTAAHRRADDR